MDSDPVFTTEPIDWNFALPFWGMCIAIGLGLGLLATAIF